ncbi:hypothetical protein BVX97_04430 [bacterium E08(2017)]|nr:hypothetical protein BVX97_04430 [bacterium E08(2017)]
MSKLGTLAFKNNEGHTYDFAIFQMDSEFKPGHGGVYIITSRHDDDHHHHGHKVICIGETDDMSTVLQDHPMQAEFETQNANCCCVHATQDAAARERIAGELIEKYLNKN